MTDGQPDGQMDGKVNRYVSTTIVGRQKWTEFNCILITLHASIVEHYHSASLLDLQRHIKQCAENDEPPTKITKYDTDSSESENESG